MDYLIIINDGPYGTERAYNALRLAMSLQKEKQAELADLTDRANIIIAF